MLFPLADPTLSPEDKPKVALRSPYWAHHCRFKGGLLHHLSWILPDRYVAY